MSSPRASVIIAAGGAGRRFVEARSGGAADAASEAKVFVALAGRPVLAYVLGAFARVPAVAEAVVAVPDDRVAWARDTFGEALSDGRPLVFVAGGNRRTDSVERALAATNPETDLVAIHDAARPLIRSRVIQEAMGVAMEQGAAVVGRPVDHTVKRVNDDARVIETVPRRHLWLAQTPQVFRREVITQAYARRASVLGPVTDDAQLVEALGRTVCMVEGDGANLKITTPEDLRTCEALLAAGWPFEA